MYNGKQFASDERMNQSFLIYSDLERRGFEREAGKCSHSLITEDVNHYKLVC